MPSLLMNWVPRKLAPNIRCVFTMIDGTPQHKALIQREPQPFTLQLTPLTDDNRQVCNVSYLVQSQSHLAWIRRIMLICFFHYVFIRIIRVFYSKSHIPHWTVLDFQHASVSDPQTKPPDLARECSYCLYPPSPYQPRI